MKKVYVVRLSLEERNRLEALVNTERVPAFRRKHAQILLLVDQGGRGPRYIDQTAAEYVGVSGRTVESVCQRCVIEGLDAALAHRDRSRGRSLALDSNAEAQPVAIACGEPAKWPARWTLYLLCDALKTSRVVLSVSHEPVRQGLKNIIKPQCQDIWGIPSKQDTVFVSTMEQLIEAYKRTYDPLYPIVCMHEASKQCVKEIRSPLPMRCVYPVRYDAEYERNGAAHLSLFYAPLSNWRRIDVKKDRDASTWAEGVRRLVEDDFPEALRITLVMDTLDTHNGASIYEAFPPEKARRLMDRLEFVHTPKHGSWLNMAKCEFSVLSRQCLECRIPDIDAVREEVVAWATHRNNHTEPAQWRFTTEDARKKLPSLYPKISV